MGRVMYIRDLYYWDCLDWTKLDKNLIDIIGMLY
jgi:hypothetical protein